MNSKITIVHAVSSAMAKCRICGNLIDRGESRIIFKGVHVSPRNVDLHFHTLCIGDALEKAALKPESMEVRYE